LPRNTKFLYLKDKESPHYPMTGSPVLWTRRNVILIRGFGGQIPSRSILILTGFEGGAPDRSVFFLAVVSKEDGNKV
jgi:hypothetical protein